MVTVSLCQDDLFKLQTETKSLDNRLYPRAHPYTQPIFESNLLTAHRHRYSIIRLCLVPII